jgi:hypothetical protein
MVYIPVHPPPPPEYRGQMCKREREKCERQGVIKCEKWGVRIT